RRLSPPPHLAAPSIRRAADRRFRSPRRTATATVRRPMPARASVEGSGTASTLTLSISTVTPLVRVGDAVVVKVRAVLADVGRGVAVYSWKRELFESGSSPGKPFWAMLVGRPATVAPPNVTENVFGTSAFAQKLIV